MVTSDRSFAKVSFGEPDMASRERRPHKTTLGGLTAKLLCQLRLPDELARVDAPLDDPAFFAPFAPFFDPRVGRPSTPMEVYLRMMFLKFRYDSATRACVGRSVTRSPGAGSVESRSMARCRTRRR